VRFKIIVEDVVIGFDLEAAPQLIPKNEGFGLFSTLERMADLTVKPCVNSQRFDAARRAERVMGPGVDFSVPEFFRLFQDFSHSNAHLWA
jgi:hypothetical protein